MVGVDSTGAVGTIVLAQVTMVLSIKLPGASSAQWVVLDYIIVE
jgi:hypothetical protein